MICVFFNSRVLVCVQAYEITVKTHGLLVTHPTCPGEHGFCARAAHNPELGSAFLHGSATVSLCI